MSENNTLEDKHVKVVSVLLKQLEDDSNRDVMKKDNGNFAMIKNLGVENTSYAADNFNRLYSTLEDYKDNNLFTDKDLKVAALYAGNTADEIKKSTLWDVLGPRLIVLWFAMFGFLSVYTMKFVNNEPEWMAFIFSGILAVTAAAFRMILVRRQTSTYRRAICYLQVEKFIKSLL